MTSSPGDHEAGAQEHDGGLGEQAAAMRDLVPGQPEELHQPGSPTVGEFYRDLADSDDVKNPSMRHLLAQAAEASLHQGRIWSGEDEAPRPNVSGHPVISEGMARQTISDAVGDASKWLDTFERGVRTDDVMRGSRTLLDLNGGAEFDHDLLNQFSKIVGMDPDEPVAAVPQSGEHAQPDRFATRHYPTRIHGVEVRAWSHRRDGGTIWEDQVGGRLRSDNFTKYSLVPAEGSRRPA